MKSTGMINDRLNGNKSYRSVRYLCLALLLFIAWTAISITPVQAANEGDNLPISIVDGATSPDTATLLNDDQQNPVVIALPDKDKWFVVWEDWRNWSTSGSDIYGRFIDENGEYCGDEIAISTASGNQTVPMLAYDNDGNILIAWQDSRSEIDDNGTPGDTADDFTVGFLYYNILDISSLATDCSTGASLGSENAVGYNPIGAEDGVSNDDNLISRKLPKAAYDTARDHFWLVWIESRNALQRIEEHAFGADTYMVGPFCSINGTTVGSPEPHCTCDDGSTPSSKCDDGSTPTCGSGSLDCGNFGINFTYGCLYYSVCSDGSVPVCGDDSTPQCLCDDYSTPRCTCDDNDNGYDSTDSSCNYIATAIGTSWNFGDSNYVGYVTVDPGTGAAVSTPEIIRNHGSILIDTIDTNDLNTPDGIFDNYRESTRTVRLISHSTTVTKDVYVYEYIKNNASKANLADKALRFYGVYGS